MSIMYRHYDTVIFNPMLYKWLLYGSCIDTVIQLHVAQCHLSVSYIDHIS